MLPLAQGVVDIGHVVEILIPAWDCPQQAGQVQQIGGVTLRYPQLGSTPQRLLDIQLVRRMFTAAKTFRPDIVHVFKPIGYSGIMASILMRQGHLVVVDVDDLETEAGWGQHRRWGLRQLVRTQEQRVLGQVNGVSAASIKLQEYAASMRIRRNGLHSQANQIYTDLCYLPNGLDLAPEPAPVASNPPIVLLYTRGNDVSAQRVHKLWSSIIKQLPEAMLHILGDWFDIPALPRYDHLGWREGEALIDALRNTALALFPVEDCPLVRAKSPGRLLDCLAQGLPVVTEAVGEYGIMAGPRAAQSVGNDAGIIDASVNLLFDHQLRREYSEYSWKQAKRQTWERRVAVLTTWYRQLHSSFVQSEGGGK
jgi:hypothetical protein